MTHEIRQSRELRLPWEENIGPGLMTPGCIRPHAVAGRRNGDHVSRGLHLSACCGARGFTLVELVVSMVVIAIISSIAYVHLSGSLANSRLRTAGQQALGAVRYAQQLALSTGNTTRVVVETGSNRYYLQWGAGGYIQMPIGNNDYIVQLGLKQTKGVNITGSGLSGGILNFNGLGTPSDGGGALTSPSVVMTLNSSTTLSVQPGTGAVSISN